MQTDFLGCFKLKEATALPCPAASHPSVIISLPYSPPSPQWWVGIGSLGLQPLEASLVKFQQTLSTTHTHTHTHTHSLTHTHTHTHTRSLPRLVTTITGNPQHSGFLSCSGLGILYLGAWILHSWRQLSLGQPCPCILCCLVLAAVLELNRPYTGKSWHVSLLETKIWVCMAYLGGDSQIKKGHKEVEEWAREAHIEQVTSVNHWSVNLLGVSSSQ